MQRSSSRKQTIFDGVKNLFQKESKSPKTKEIHPLNGDTLDSQDTRGDLSFIIRKSVAFLDPDMFQKSGKIFLGKIGKTVNDVSYALKLCQITGKEIVFSEIQGKEFVRYSLDSFVLQRLGNLPVHMEKREEMAHVFGLLFQEKEILMCCLTLQELGDWIEVLNLISMRNFANQQNTEKYRSKIEITYNDLKDEFKIFQETQQGDEFTNKKIYTGYKEKIEECMIFTEDDYEVKQNGSFFTIEKVSLYVHEDHEVKTPEPEMDNTMLQPLSPKLIVSPRDEGRLTPNPRYKTQLGVSDYELLKMFQMLENNFHESWFGFDFGITVLESKLNKDRATKILKALIDRKCMTGQTLDDKDVLQLKPKLLVFKMFGFKGETEEEGTKWINEKLK